MQKSYLLISFLVAAFAVSVAVAVAEIKQTGDIVNNNITIEIPAATVKAETPVDIAPLFVNYVAGLLAESEGDLEAAGNFFINAEIADPQNIHIKEKAFALQLAQGNMETSFRLAKTLEKQADALPLVFIVNAINDVLQDKNEQAAIQIAKAEKASPKLLQFKLMQSYLDLAQGKNIDEVIEGIKNFKNISAFAAHSHYHIGRILEQQGRLTDAAQEYKIAYEIDRSSTQPVMRLGAIYENMDKLEDAQELYANFIENNPQTVMLQASLERIATGKKPLLLRANLRQDWAEVLFGFSTLMASQNIEIAAKHLLNMVVALDKNYPAADFYFGLLAERFGHLNIAQKHYAKVKRNNYTWLAAKIRLADIIFLQGKQKQAITTLSKLADNYEEIPIFRRIIAEMYYNSKQYDKAIEQYSHIISALEKPSKADAVTFFARGASYERLEDYTKAEADLEQSLKLNPNNPVVLNYLGYMWVDRGEKVKQGFDYIRRALILKPGDGSIVDSLGWAWFRRGEVEKAVLFLEKAVEIMPEDPTINDHLGDAYHAVGRKMEANIQWKRALKLIIDDSKLREEIRGKLTGR